MSQLEEILSDDQFSSLIQYANPTSLIILYFHTPWAAPCAQMKTILSTLASTYPEEAPIKFLSINAEDLPDISESYDVTAVPFLVLQRDGKTLETVSGSDAAKARAAVEKYAGAGGSGGAAQGGVKAAIPPALSADPSVAPKREPAAPTQNGSANGVTKDLSGYAPKESDPQTAPEFSSGQENKEELNTRLANLVKAAPVRTSGYDRHTAILTGSQVMLFMKGTPSAPQCGFSRQLVSLLRENQVKYGTLPNGLPKCYG
jgi:thiol-disulfide isomerase/thioredoxin